MRSLRVPGFADRIAACLRARGVTQSAFAAEHSRRHPRTRITQSNLSRWMRNQVPSFESLQELAEALEVPWEYLLLGEEGAQEILRHTGSVPRATAIDPDLRNAWELVAQIHGAGDKNQWTVLLELLKTFRATTVKAGEAARTKSTRRG